MMRKLLINTITIASLILTGCATGTDDRVTGILPMDKLPGIYRIPIRQGNLITQEMVNELKPGMTKQQVRYLLGTPLLIDTFNEDRWEYLFTNKPGSRSANTEIEQRNLELLFRQGRLYKITGDMYPQGEELAQITKEENRERTIVIPPDAPRDEERLGIFERTLNKVTGYDEDTRPQPKPSE